MLAKLVLLYEVRPAKQAMKLHTLLIDMWYEALMRSDEVKHGFAAAAAAAQDEAILISIHTSVGNPAQY